MNKGVYMEPNLLLHLGLALIFTPFGLYAALNELDKRSS
jgi:hypothetical protein